MLYNFYLRSFCVRCQGVKFVWGQRFFLTNFFQTPPTPSKLEIIDHSHFMNTTHDWWNAGVKGISSRTIFSYFLKYPNFGTTQENRRTPQFYIESWYLKELTEGHHQEWSLWLNLTQHGKKHDAEIACAFEARLFVREELVMGVKGKSGVLQNILVWVALARAFRAFDQMCTVLIVISLASLRAAAVLYLWSGRLATGLTNVVTNHYI